MENFDTAQKVKQKREGTLGNTPEAGIPQMPRTPQPNKLAQKAQEVRQRKEAEVVAATPAPEKPSVKFVKGFQVGITEDGFLKLIPFGEVNYMDIISLTEYARVKKDDILAELAASKTHQLTKETVEIAKNVKHLLGAVGE